MQRTRIGNHCSSKGIVNRVFFLHVCSAIVQHECSGAQSDPILSIGLPEDDQ